MKKMLPAIVLCLLSLPSLAMSENPQDAVSFTKNFKVTVEVETPEGLKTGSAVRQISNSKSKNSLGWPDVGNPADVIGEAVVIDLGERGVLFALISDNADSEFYNAFPVPEGAGNTTVEGIEFYDSLPLGKTAALDQQDWPMFVTFTDIDDPKSVTLVWGSVFNPETQKYEPVNRMEELYGESAKLSGYSLEITNEPLTWGSLNSALNESFWKKFDVWWATISAETKMKYARLFKFRMGDPP